MRILLDECVPRPLRHELPGHDVSTVAEMGWAGRTNGELMKLMEQAEFGLFLTIDQGVRYQQKLSRTSLAVVVLAAASNRVDDLTPLMPAVRTALSSIQPGELVEIRS